MGLRQTAEAKAAETTKATLKIGSVSQLRLQAGVVARYADALQKPKCFVAYTDQTEEVTRQEAIVLAKKVTGKDQTDFFPCLWVEVIPDTSMTPTSRYQGSFVSLETPGNNPRTHKRLGTFIFDHMSPELEDLAGKKVWAHIAWKRISEVHGGDLTLTGNKGSDELSMIITYLENKRAATDLVKNLREGVTNTDALCVARGYDVTGIRAKLKEAAEVAAKGGGKEKGETSVLSEIGELTKKNYTTLEFFTNAETHAFLKQNFDVSKDIAAVAEKCSAEPGDVAILLNQPTYFKVLMEATGLGEQEAIAKVAVDTGLANAADLAAFLGVEEAPF